MQVLLLERIGRLGKFGDKVEVANGYARNYLLPRGKAVLANKQNIAEFEKDRAKLAQIATERLQAMQERAAEINSLHLTVTARAGDEGKLYGSIGTSDLVKAFKDKGVAVQRQEIRLPQGPLRETGDFMIDLQLHAEVTARVKITIVAEEEK